MSDIYFKQYYDQIKGIDWPQNVENYSDFIKLPEKIKKECYEQHSLKSRLDQMEDKNYWELMGSATIGYRYKQVIYVPIPKCASTYYLHLFHTTLDWTPVLLHEQDWNNVSAFGFMMHPLTRRIKGIVEILCESFQDDYNTINSLLSDTRFQHFMESINIADLHSIPYSVLLRSVIDKIHWIPLDLGNDIWVKKQLIDFLNQKEIYDVNIPLDDDRRYRSSKDKLEVFQKLKNIYMNKSETELGNFYSLFSDDLKFYRKLLDNFIVSSNQNT